MTKVKKQKQMKLGMGFTKMLQIFLSYYKDLGPFLPYFELK